MFYIKSDYIIRILKGLKEKKVDVQMSIVYSNGGLF
jgi:hypothetical protein